MDAGSRSQSQKSGAGWKEGRKEEREDERRDEDAAKSERRRGRTEERSKLLLTCCVTDPARYASLSIFSPLVLIDYVSLT